MNFDFYLKSLFLGVGLAMDAFSVSLANGLNEPKMRKAKIFLIAGTFAFFQALMPLFGWFCVREIMLFFEVLRNIVPYVSLVLLCFVGGKMIFEANNKNAEEMIFRLSAGSLLVQALATSIDALSVGFTVAGLEFFPAFTASMIISAVTFLICLLGVNLGKKFGTAFSGKAQILGGLILIFIGVEIFIKNMVK